VPLRRLDPPTAYDARLASLEQERAQLDPLDVRERRRITEQLTRLSGERAVAARLRPSGGTLSPEIQAIALGRDCVILGLPGEFFVETARAIQDQAGVRHLLIACYANHHVFYVVPKHEFDRGGYEPGVSMLDETAEDTMRRAAIEIVREVTS
jgi:hypothetical protein